VSGARELEVVRVSKSDVERLHDALARLESEPTINFETVNARVLLDKAMASSTQEVTISAQALRLLLPAIEGEAKTLTIRRLRAALAEDPE
jgi:hypothetical protein